MLSPTRRVPGLAPPSMEPAKRVVYIVPTAASCSPEQDRWRESTRDSYASSPNSAHLLLVQRGGHSRATPVWSMGVLMPNGTRYQFAASEQTFGRDTRTCCSCPGPCACESPTSAPWKALCVGQRRSLSASLSLSLPRNWIS